MCKTSPELKKKVRESSSAPIHAKYLPRAFPRRLAKVDLLQLIISPNQNMTAMAWLGWMAAFGGASGVLITTILINAFRNVNLDKWAFDRDHAGREKFVKV